MNKLRELLQAFPEYWHTDDESVPVLIMRYHGASCMVSIENDRMEVIPSESNRIIIQLDQIVPDELTYIPYILSINQLVAILLDQVPGLEIDIVSSNFKHFYDGTLKPDNLDNIWRTFPNIWTNYPLPPGITRAQDLTGPPIDPVTGIASGPPDGILDTIGWYTNVPGTARPIMVSGYPTSIGELGAIILTDTCQDVVQNGAFGAPTNLIWTLLKPISRMLRQSAEYGDALVKQIDLRNVDGPWLDRWGEIYGVERIYPEDDFSYRRRMVSTTFKPKLSPTSMEKALMEGFGFSVARIIDSSNLGESLYTLSTSESTFLSSPYTFLVQSYLIPELASYLGEPVRDVINTYRAAGTQFILTGVVDAPVEVIPRPLQTFRMRQFRPDPLNTGATIVTGYSSFDDGPWGVDINYTTAPLDTPKQLWGGREFGESTFG